MLSSTFNTSKIKHIFFDWDHTIWDFEANSAQTLTEIYTDFQLNVYGLPSPQEFIKQYSIENEKCWAQYLRGHITRETLRKERFERVLAHFGAENNALAQLIGEAYIENGPHKTRLMPHAHEIISALSKKYQLHILTNGFDEVQRIKIKGSGLEHEFNHLITSETAQVKKPHKDFFNFALKTTGATPENCLMIGDNIDVDIKAAKKVGIGGIWFNPEQKKSNKKVDATISCLSELKQLLIVDC